MVIVTHDGCFREPGVSMTTMAVIARYRSKKSVNSDNIGNRNPMYEACLITEYNPEESII